MYGHFPRDSRYFPSYLVFRPRQKDSCQYLNEFAALCLELVFHEIPGQSVQGRWMLGRGRPIVVGLRRLHLHPIRRRVLRIPAPPGCLRLRPALALAFPVRARPLPRAHPLIRPEPFSTIPAWPLLQPRAHPLQARRTSTSPPPAYFWRADPDYFSRAAKPCTGFGTSRAISSGLRGAEQRPSPRTTRGLATVPAPRDTDQDSACLASFERGSPCDRVVAAWT